jgi:hypothetical protein
MCRNSTHHVEDWKGRGTIFEVRKWCILAHEDMGPRSWCPLQVRLQDGGELRGDNLFEMDFLTPAAAKHCFSNSTTMHLSRYESSRSQSFLVS